jgi:fatty acid-binding protein DegV
MNEPDLTFENIHFTGTRRRRFSLPCRVTRPLAVLTTRLGIPVLPQIVIFGEKSFRDDTELDTSTFLEMLRSSPQLPKTSAPPPPLYYPIIEKAIQNGDTLICIHPSSKISGTVRSVQVASQDFPAGVLVELKL